MECMQKFPHDRSESLQRGLAVPTQALIKAAQMWVMSDGD
jgi:hypothetical protein